MQGVVERRTPHRSSRNVLIEPTAMQAWRDGDRHGDRSAVPRGRQGEEGGTDHRQCPQALRDRARGPADEVTLKACSDNDWIEVSPAGPSSRSWVSTRRSSRSCRRARRASGSAITIAAGTLREMIENTIFAVSTDETRVNLSGMYIETTDNGRLRMVATDGHRLAMIERTLSRREAPPRASSCRARGWSELRKLLEDSRGRPSCRLTVAEKDARVQTPAPCRFFMRLDRGRVPRLPPGDPQGAVACERHA